MFESSKTARLDAKNPNPSYIPPGCKIGHQKQERKYMDYFRAGASKWMFFWNGGACEINHITQETIIRRAGGKTKIILRSVTSSGNLLVALKKNKLEKIDIVHEYSAIPIGVTPKAIPMRETFNNAHVKILMERGEPQFEGEMVIYAETEKETSDPT